MLTAGWLLPTHVSFLNICLLVCKKGVKHVTETQPRSTVTQYVSTRSYLYKTKVKAFYYLLEQSKYN